MDRRGLKVLHDAEGCINSRRSTLYDPFSLLMRLIGSKDERCRYTQWQQRSGVSLPGVFIFPKSTSFGQG